IDSGCAYFTTPVVELSGRHGITGIEQLTQPAEELFESRKLLLATYLAGAIRVRNLLGAHAILPWALRGADILQSGRARGEAYFRLESAESVAAGRRISGSSPKRASRSSSSTCRVSGSPTATGCWPCCSTCGSAARSIS